MDKSKFYINLSKCSEEQVRILAQVIKETIIQISEFPLLFWDGTEWDQVKKGDKLNIIDKTELSSPEFIKLFEGGEGENNGWIKIESEADLPKEDIIYWVVKNGEVVDMEDWELTLNFHNKRGVTHYQPIIKPESPKS